MIEVYIFPNARKSANIVTVSQKFTKGVYSAKSPVTSEKSFLVISAESVT